MSSPLTTAHTSADGGACGLHPDKPTSAAKTPHRISPSLNTQIPLIVHSRKDSSGGLLHPARTQTGGADAEVFAHAVDDGTDAAQVRVPAAPTNIVGVANDVSVARPLAANVASLGHCCSSRKN